MNYSYHSQNSIYVVNKLKPINKKISQESQTIHKKMAAKTLKLTIMLMLVMVVMHIVSATSDSQTCKDDCVNACTIAEEIVDYGCYLTCAEKCGGDDDEDDDDDDYPDPPILVGIFTSSLSLYNTLNLYLKYVDAL